MVQEKVKVRQVTQTTRLPLDFSNRTTGVVIAVDCGHVIKSFKKKASYYNVVTNTVCSFTSRSVTIERGVRLHLITEK